MSGLGNATPTFPGPNDELDPERERQLESLRNDAARFREQLRDAAAAASSPIEIEPAAQPTGDPITGVEPPSPNDAGDGIAESLAIIPAAESPHIAPVESVTLGPYPEGVYRPRVCRSQTDGAEPSPSRMPLTSEWQPPVSTHSVDLATRALLGAGAALFLALILPASWEESFLFLSLAFLGFGVLEIRIRTVLKKEDRTSVMLPIERRALLGWAVVLYIFGFLSQSWALWWFVAAAALYGFWLLLRSEQARPVRRRGDDETGKDEGGGSGG